MFRISVGISCLLVVIFTVVDLEVQCRHITDAGDMPSYVTHVARCMRLGWISQSAFDILA